MPFTTGITTSIGDHERIHGNESWSVIGNMLPYEDITAMIKEMASENLMLHYDCTTKAKIAAHYAKKKYEFVLVRVGMCLVYSSDWESSYGFYYNPPYEFHSWAEVPEVGIIDIGLPGIIHNGLNSKDDVGYFLCGREPAILCGDPPCWVRYSAYENYGPDLWRDNECMIWRKSRES